MKLYAIKYLYNSNKINLYGYYNDNRSYYIYDLNTNNLDILNAYDMTFYDVYIIVHDNDKNVYYSALDNEYTPIEKGLEYNDRYIYLENNNKNYILIDLSKTYETYTGYYKLCIFDIDSLKYYDLTDKLNGKNFEVYENKYIVTYLSEYYQEYNFDNKNIADFIYYCNNEIYVIDYDNFTLSYLYTFKDKSIDYSGGLNLLLLIIKCILVLVNLKQVKYILIRNTK